MTLLRSQMYRVVCVVMMTALFVFVGAPHTTAAITIPPHPYPRTAAFFLKSSAFTEAEIRALAQFHVVILAIENQNTNRQVLTRLRAMNPSIVILGYNSAVEYPLNTLAQIELPGGIWHQIGAGIRPEWYLKTASGVNMSIWPGNVLMNPIARSADGLTYAEYLARFLKTSVLDTGLWDGLFFDTVFDGIWWNNHDADTDRDGQADGKERTDKVWQDGQNLLFSSLRSMIGDRYLLVGNGVLEPYAASLNGRMFESFPEKYEGEWTGSVKRYFNISRIGATPHIAIINRDSDDTGNQKDWNRMRYGLATALLADAYYNFDWGAKYRDHLWHYDEYDVSLGKPSSLAPVNLLTGKSETIEPGLWFRNFQNGIVLVNSTAQAQEWRFEEEFERFRGTQDPETNNGSITKRVTVPAESGLLLLRPIEAIVGTPFVNGAFARIFNRNGQSTRNGFFAYEQKERGSTLVARRDLDRDGTQETVVADRNRIIVRKADGTERASFFPYGERFTSNVRFALGDMTNDGRDEIITIPANDASADIRLFDLDGRSVSNGWTAGRKESKGGGSVAVGDVDGDGTLEVIVGAGRGEPPRVMVYRANGTPLSKDGWLAYAPGVRTGVNVASGDLDGDRRAEVVVGAGRGGGPHIRIFSGDGKVVHKGFFAFDSKKREGVDVLVTDTDGDGRSEIFAMSTNVFTTASLFRR